MGSGKGVFVAQMVHNTRTRGLLPIAMKPGTDTKAGELIVSRVGMGVPVDILAAQQDLKHGIEETDVHAAVKEHLGARAASLAHLIVDEVQFFSPAQVEHSTHWPITTTCLSLPLA